jgi:hypothetical protein
MLKELQDIYIEMPKEELSEKLEKLEQNKNNKRNLEQMMWSFTLLCSKKIKGNKLQMIW